MTVSCATPTHLLPFPCHLIRRPNPARVSIIGFPQGVIRSIDIPNTKGISTLFLTDFANGVQGIRIFGSADASTSKGWDVFPFSGSGLFGELLDVVAFAVVARGGAEVEDVRLNKVVRC